MNVLYLRHKKTAYMKNNSTKIMGRPKALNYRNFEL